MSDLKYFEEKIKEKRKKTDFRDFVKEIASWCPLILSKNNGIISRFPDTKRVKMVINKEKYEEQRDGLLKYGIDYNKSESFIQNFNKLFVSTDLPNLRHYTQNENSDFADTILNSKNVYLSNTVISGCENVLYSFSVKDYSTNVLNSIMVWDNSENIYMSTGVTKGFNIFYSRFIDNSNNIWFSTNLVGCSECFGCNGLINKSFCINNKEYSKDDYFRFKNDLLSKKDNFSQWQNTTTNTKGNNIASENVEGDCIIESSNIENGHFVYHVKNGRNIILGGTMDGNENMYDIFTGGSPSGNDYYGLFGGGKGDNIYIGCHIVDCSNIYYSYDLGACSFCLGCIGLKNKSYCILNKQYTKEEWYKKVEEIFAQMEKDGILGDFFPGNLNPFYFNDTMAYLIDDSFTKEEVEKESYMWRDEEIKVDIPEGAEVILTSPLTPLLHERGTEGEFVSDYQGYDSNGNWQINPEILKKVIKDEKGNIYRIVQMEYDFLVKHGLPLPEIHWLDRIKMGFSFK